MNFEIRRETDADLILGSFCVGKGRKVFLFAPASIPAGYC
jgi:hypothetical protein